MDLVLAVVLLQSIISFQPRPEQTTLSKSYHEILVMVSSLFTAGQLDTHVTTLLTTHPHLRR